MKPQINTDERSAAEPQPKGERKGDAEAQSARQKGKRQKAKKAKVTRKKEKRKVNSEQLEIRRGLQRF